MDTTCTRTVGERGGETAGHEQTLQVQFGPQWWYGGGGQWFETEGGGYDG